MRPIVSRVAQMCVINEWKIKYYHHELGWAMRENSVKRTRTKTHYSFFYLFNLLIFLFCVRFLCCAKLMANTFRRGLWPFTVRFDCNFCTHRPINTFIQQYLTGDAIASPFNSIVHSNRMVINWSGRKMMPLQWERQRVKRGKERENSARSFGWLPSNENNHDFMRQMSFADNMRRSGTVSRMEFRIVQDVSSRSTIESNSFHFFWNDLFFYEFTIRLIEIQFLIGKQVSDALRQRHVTSKSRCWSSSSSSSSSTVCLWIMY